MEYPIKSNSFEKEVLDSVLRDVSAGFKTTQPLPDNTSIPTAVKDARSNDAAPGYARHLIQQE